jgi:hypothetical protein
MPVRADVMRAFTVKTLKRVFRRIADVNLFSPISARHVEVPHDFLIKKCYSLRRCSDVRIRVRWQGEKTLKQLIICKIAVPLAYYRHALCATTFACDEILFVNRELVFAWGSVDAMLEAVLFCDGNASAHIGYGALSVCAAMFGEGAS